MYNYFPKFCLILLFFCIMLPVYTMEKFFSFYEELMNKYDQYKIYRALEKATEKAYRYNFRNQQDCEEIKKCIEQGADPNHVVLKGDTLVGLSALFLNVDLLKYLIRKGADIDKKDQYNYPPLEYVTSWQYGSRKNNSELETIKALCNAGASLIFDDATVFHYLTTTFNNPQTKIETIIEHTRFDSCNQKEDEQLKEKVILFLCASKQVGLPEELQLQILSMVTLDYFHGYNKRLCKKLAELGYTNSLFTHIEKRIEKIKQILRLPDRNGETALDWSRLYNKSEQVQRLFDGTRLDDDIVKFKELFPKNMKEIPENNLVLKIYNNAQQLLLEK